MFRPHPPSAAQGPTEYAGLLVQQALFRVQLSLRTLDEHELAGVAAAAVALLLLLLRRGRTDLP